MGECCISGKTIWSILDPSVILCTPWTLRKILFWALYLGIAGAAVVCQLFFDWWRYFAMVFRADILWFGIFIFLVEPFMILLSIVTVGVYPVPPKQVLQKPKMVNGKRVMVKVDRAKARRKKNKDLAVVIACHNSRDIIPNTVKACLAHVKPQQIYIVDNGNSEKPTDDSKQVLQKCSPRSKYIWNGYGNKTLAQYAGVMACKRYKYVLVLDDDVILPEELDMGLDLVEGNTVGVVYPIRACHPERRYSLFVEWQSLEYQLTGYNKLLQHKSGTVQYPHGAASLWDRNALKKALRSHDTIFYGEDAKLGLWALQNGHELKMKPEVVIYTESPTTFLGEMPNFWTQRVRSWDMALHCYIGQYIQVFFCTAHSSICGTLLMKLTQGYTVFSIVADWLRVPLLVLAVGMTQFYITFGLYLALAVFMIFLWNTIAYWNRKDLRISFLCIITYPIYACLVLFTRFFGLLRAIFIYLPNYRRPPKIPEIEDSVIESWNQACLDVEGGGGGGDDTDSDDEVEGVPVPSSDVREPVWLTEEAFELTTCASSRGDDYSVSVVHETNRGMMAVGGLQGSRLPPSNRTMSSLGSSLRSSNASGYPMPYAVESSQRRHGSTPEKKSSTSRPTSSTSRSPRGPIDLDAVTEHEQQRSQQQQRYSSSRHERVYPSSSRSPPPQQHVYPSSRSPPPQDRRAAPDSVQRWRNSVNNNSDRHVSFARRERSDNEDWADDAGFNRSEI